MEPTNEARAAYALEALTLFARRNNAPIDREGFATTAVDFLTNLAHLCDSEGVKLCDLLDTARMHYDAESIDGLAFGPPDDMDVANPEDLLDDQDDDMGDCGTDEDSEDDNADAQNYDNWNPPGA